MNRDYLILGHPRSGTGYMAKLFQANGFDVRHETIGEHGTSNWQFAVKAKEYQFPSDEFKRQDIDFKNIFHVIRHPLHAINSIVFTEQRSEGFRNLYIPLCGNKFERAVMSYYGWNMLIQSQMPDKTFTLDNAQKVLGFANSTKVYNQRDHECMDEYEIKTECNAVIWEYYICMAHFYNDLLKSENNE